MVGEEKKNMKSLLFLETNSTGTGSKAMKIAKEFGFKVHFWTIGFEQYSSMNEEEHPKNICDEFLVIDTYDVKKMIKIIKDRGLNFSGVLAFDDYHLYSAAAIAKEFSLPGHSLQSLERVRNKGIMREYLSNSQFELILQPKYYIISSLEDLKMKEISFPCIIKPVDDSGSNGVSICANKKQLKKALIEEMKRKVNERGYHLKNEWIVEELLKGNEYSAEMIYSNGKWKLISITEKETFGNHSVECGHVTGLLDFSFDDLEYRISMLLNLFGLDYGAAHVEFFINDEILYLVEINPRLAGDLIPELVEIATGINMVKETVAQSVKEYTCIEHTKMKFAAIQFFLPTRIGKYKSVNKIDELKQIDGFVRISLNQLPYISNGVKSSYDRLGYVITSGETKEKAVNSAKKAINMLEWSVIDE
jgi:biotin carboxylase